MKSCKPFMKKVPFLTTTAAWAMAMFSITASAATLGTDSVSSSIYGTVATGQLVVNDTNAYATTSYSRSGSNISVSARIYSTERYMGSDHHMDDGMTTDGGGALAQVELNIDEYPNAVFLEMQGQHEVIYRINGIVLQSGYWMDSTYWER